MRRGKSLKLKARFSGRRPSIPATSNTVDVDEAERRRSQPETASSSFFSGNKINRRKVRSKAAKETTEHSDDDVYSDVSDEQDELFLKNSKARFQLERTWSVNAFQISSHSAGVVYLDESEDDSDTDDDSSCDEFGSEGSDDDCYVSDDEDEDNTTANTTNKTKGDKTGRTSSQKKKRGSEAKKSESRRSTSRSGMNKYKKEKKPRDVAPEMIPEGNEDEEDEDDSNSDSNGNDNESDDNSVSYYDTPASLTRPPNISRLSSNHAENVESGYSSDSALVRKRQLMIQQQQNDARRKQDTEESSNEGKKKKGGKKKPSSKRKEKKKGNKNRSNDEKYKSAQNGGGSLEGDSTVTTISVESEEDILQSHEPKVEKNGKKKKKKKKKKNNTKNDKKKKKRAVISFIVDGDDEACANFDDRLQEIELFEAALVEERKLIQKKSEAMAFERESMEMRFDEETRHCDELNLRIKELEQLVQSQKISNAGNDAESIDEKNVLKLDFAREKRESHLQLVDKEREIENLKLAVRDLKVLQGATRNIEDNSFDSTNMADGKSRERLQGELLQMVAKLSGKEAQLKSQGKELDLAHEELASLKDSSENSELKNFLIASQEDSKRLQQELENERKENAVKLKDKDETVQFLMNELARLKKGKSH